MEIKASVFDDLIKDYRHEYIFEPLKIVFNISTPIYLNNPYLNFDSIISYLCLREALNDYFYILPSETTVDISQLQIPLKKTDELYHASIGFYNKKSQLKTDKLFKRFTDKQIHHLTPNKNKGKIHINRGHFKDFIINLPMIITDEVVFYCNGDKNKLKELLKHLTNIGKKQSIGGGKIKSFNITSTSMDYSFFKDNTVMRPIPVNNVDLPPFYGMIIQKSTYKPPYWDNKDVVMCYMPPNQIKELIDNA